MANSRAWKKNVCVAMVSGALAVPVAHATPVLSLSPSPTTPAAGGTLALDVVITGITDLYSFNYSITFNPGLAKLVGETEGSFFTGTGNTTSYLAGTVDNTAGTYTFTGNALIGSSKGVTGSGVLEHLTFSVLSGLPSTFGFVAADTGFYDTLSNAITVTANSLTLNPSAVPEPASAALLGLGVAGVLVWRRRSTSIVREGARA